MAVVNHEGDEPKCVCVQHSIHIYLLLHASARYDYNPLVVVSSNQCALPLDEGKDKHTRGRVNEETVEVETHDDDDDDDIRAKL